MYTNLGKLPVAIGSGTYAQHRSLLHFSAFAEVLADNAQLLTSLNIKASVTLYTLQT